MRIGISTLMIQRGKTGVAQYIFALLKALQELGTSHRFVLFALEQDTALFSEVAGSMATVIVDERFRPAVKNIAWHQLHLPSLVRQHGLDVLHVPSYRRLLARKQCKLVATIHDLAPFRVPGKYDWKRMFYGRVVVRRLAHRQDRIIAVSQNTADDITRFFKLPSNRVSVIHNGLDHGRFYPAPRARAKTWAHERFGLNQPFFLYVARLEHPGKNHLRLISAFERFKLASEAPWQLVFGGSDWHGAEVIHAAIRTSPQREHVRCLGFVRDGDLPQLYRAADVFVYPSLYEGFGLPPLEAMACGCPVVCSGRGSLAEVTGQAALILEPEDIEQMATQIARAALDGATAERLRRAGLEQAGKFNWRHTAERTLQVYEQVVDPHAPRDGEKMVPVAA